MIADHEIYETLPDCSYVQLLTFGRHAEAIDLAWRPEVRGCPAGLDDDGLLVVTPQAGVTHYERQALARHHGEQVSLVQACDEVIV